MFPLRSKRPRCFNGLKWFGMFPSNLLFLKFNCSKFTRLCNDGMLPLKRFPLNSRKVRLLRLLISSGMFPSIVLFFSDNLDRLVEKLPMDNGKIPLSLFQPKNSCCSWEQLPLSSWLKSKSSRLRREAYLAPAAHFHSNNCCLNWVFQVLNNFHWNSVCFHLADFPIN